MMVRISTIVPVFLSLQGSEFSFLFGSEWAEDRDMHFYRSVSSNIYKNSQVERSNRSVLEKLHRYMSFKKTLNWTNHLQEVINSLNSKPMKVLNYLSPKSARLPQNEKMLKLKFYHDREKYSLQFRNVQPKFQIGDKVLVLKKPILIGFKGFRDNTTGQIEEITHIYDTKPVTYGLKFGRRKFYGNELRYFNENKEIAPDQESTNHLQPSVKPTTTTTTTQQQQQQQQQQPQPIPDYYVAETVQKHKNLRSGTKHGISQNEYILKSHSDPDFHLLVSEETKQKLEHESKL